MVRRPVPRVVFGQRRWLGMLTELVTAHTSARLTSTSGSGSPLRSSLGAKDVGKRTYAQSLHHKAKGCEMPKYLWTGSYTLDGLKGVLKEGGTSRREAMQAAVESIGGTLEAFYFAFGTNDFYIIAEVPDNASSLAGSMLANASGAIRAQTVVLLAPEEVDEATKRSAQYRPPGT